MENSFIEPQKSNYQSEAHRKDSSKDCSKPITKKFGEKNRIGNKNLTHKSIWRSINIFSKIKKVNKTKANETNCAVEERNSTVINNDYYQNKKCKPNKMDDESSLEKNEASGSADDESASIESKNSFFGKMNLENLLKIFVDLHKKKQQNSKVNKQIIEHQSEAETNYIEKEQFIEDQDMQSDSVNMLQNSRSTSYGVHNNNNIDNSFVQSGILPNPMNSPSILNGNCEKEDTPNISENINSTNRTDSTLSLLQSVRIKLNNYLNTEIKDNDGDKNEVCQGIDLNIEIEDQVKTNKGQMTNDHAIDVEALHVLDSKININESYGNNADFKEHCVLVPDHCSSTVNDTNDIEVDVKYENVKDIGKNLSEYEETIIHNRENNDNKLAYAIVECDIKCMIKELLRESKDLKNSIVATGVEEEPIPQFTQINKNLESAPMCQSLFNDIVNMATNKHTHTSKHRKHLNVTFKQDIEEDVDAILKNLVENVFNTEPVLRSQEVYINFCLVQDNHISKIKKFSKDPKSAKFRESNVYNLTKKLRKMQASTRRTIYPPKVTVNNLSTNKYIKFMTVENSLINRIRRSAALLMALYDEMRDYTYYSCTSNILCELYESMMRQGLISVAHNTLTKSITTVPVAVNTSSDEKNETNQQLSVTSKSNISTNVKLFSPSNLPCSSSGNNNPSGCIDARTFSSNDSLSSESDVEEIKPRLVLPNLKYTYQSEEEINTPEEVKMIDDNASRNKECTEMNVNELDPVSDDSISLEYVNVNINEDETFSKQ